MSAPNAQRFEQIRALLADTQRAAERLLNVLYEERNALRDDDSDALTICASRKRMHLAALEKLGHQRQAILAANELPDTMKGMRTFIGRFGQAAELESAWSRVIALLTECRDANNGNGIVIAAQHRQKQEALRVIRGQDELGDTETYSQDGKTETTGQYRALVEV